MRSYFSSKFFRDNRSQLRERLKSSAPIVITANGLLQRGADSAYSFSQDANFWYLTGIDEPDIVLVMENSREYLIVPARSASRQAFDGSVSPKALSNQSGISMIYEGEEGWNKLAVTLKKSKQVGMISAPPAYVEQYGLYTNPARASLIEKVQSYNSQLELIDINTHLVHQRMIKQPAELKALQSAIDITIQALEDVNQRLNKYKFEYEVEADISRSFRASGASGHAFDPIVAGGRNACTLHNVANNDKLSVKNLLIMDVGAEVEHYAADITRTRGLGEPNKRQRQVHAAVLDVQAYALDLLKPGVILKQYEKQVENYLGEKLVELGLIKAVEHTAVRRYFPHGTSHFLGLNVHDIADYEQPLEPGVVLTCEPGIYIPEEGIGVRIEDDILITPRGHKVLSAKLPRAL